MYYGMAYCRDINYWGFTPGIRVIKTLNTCWKIKGGGGGGVPQGRDLGYNKLGPYSDLLFAWDL